MSKNLSLQRKITLPSFLTLAIILLSGLIALLSISKHNARTDKIIHEIVPDMLAIEQLVSEINLAMKTTEIYAETGDPGAKTIALQSQEKILALARQHTTNENHRNTSLEVARRIGADARRLDFLLKNILDTPNPEDAKAFLIKNRQEIDLIKDKTVNDLAEHLDQHREEFFFLHHYWQIVSKSVLITTLLSFLMVLLVSVISFKYIRRGIITPIQQLRDGVEQLTGHDYSCRLYIKTGDEIESLAMEYNKMADHLSNHISSLKEQVAERTSELTLAYNNIVEENEIRRVVENRLIQSKEDLEQKVQKRTKELFLTNTSLRAEIAEHKKTVDKLRENEKKLEAASQKTKDTNAALQLLIGKIRDEKKELEEILISKIDELIVPYVKKLQKSGLNDKQNDFVNLLEFNLKQIFSTSQKRRSITANFTATEMRVANLIKQGKATKEIAELLDVSPRTIETHRDNIRKKIGIKNKAANLRHTLISTQ